jgi:hypothetical protein
MKECLMKLSLTCTLIKNIKNKKLHYESCRKDYILIDIPGFSDPIFATWKKIGSIAFKYAFSVNVCKFFFMFISYNKGHFI